MQFELSTVLGWTRGRVVNDTAYRGKLGDVRVAGVAQLDRAGREHIAFFFSREFERDLPRSHAGVLVTGDPFVGPLSKSGLSIWSEAVVIASPDPYLALAAVSEKLASASSTIAHTPGGPRREGRVHPTAIVDPAARVGRGAEIGPRCVVEAGAEIGESAVLYAGVTVGPGARVGAETVLFPGVTLYERVAVGRRCRIHAGAVLGADGFGYAPEREGGAVVRHRKIYHLGSVVVGDDVEIGANSCVDRGTIGDTVIEDGAKIDNLVQVGHNATVEKGAVVCGSAALAGSSRVGAFAYVGGLTGVSNKVVVGAGAKVAACALVTKDVPPGGTAVGNPQREYSEHFRAHAVLNKMASRKRRGDGNA
jgi:UDP-3-O-[3-hydroxymyristoyl] glucosamine N-acyltransferase